MLQQMVDSMGHRCSEVDCHLPISDSEDLNFICNRCLHLTLADTKGSASYGVVPHLMPPRLASAITRFCEDLFNASVIMGDDQHACRQIKRWIYVKAMVPRSYTHSACLLLIYGINSAPTLRGIVIVNPAILSSLKGILLLKQHSSSNAVLPLLSIQHLSQVTVLILSFHSPTIAAAWIHLFSAMPHLRHRLRSRCGSSRGCPARYLSSPSSISASLSSGTLPGHYPRTRSGRGHYIDTHHGWSSLAPRPPATSPPPTTCSARFTFSSSLIRPRITALFTVVFHEESSALPVGLEMDPAQTSNFQMGEGSASLQVPEVPASSVPDVAMAPADPGPSKSEEALARDLMASGWCRIVEEPPND